MKPRSSTTNERRRNRHRFIAVGSLAALILAACGSDTADQADPAADVASTEMAMADDMEAMADDMTGDMEGHDDDMHDDDHEHDGATDAIPWDDDTMPTLDVAVTGDPESGWDIVATVSGFTFSDPTEIDHVAGRGHTHVYLDGRLVSMSYEREVHIDELEPGPHQAMVTLSRNDHVDYSLDGELITAMATFVVPGEVVPADSVLTVTYLDGEISGVDDRANVSTGDVVELTVESDVPGTVHLHGYDLYLEVEDGEAATMRFTADIPGVFEVEMEETGAPLFKLQVS